MSKEGEEDENFDVDSFFAEMKQEQEEKIQMYKNIDKERIKVAREGRKKRSKKEIKKRIVRKELESETESEGETDESEGESEDETDSEDDHSSPKIENFKLFDYDTPIELLNLLQHDINCILSSSQVQKIQSMKTIRKNLEKATSKVKRFIFSHIFKELVTCIEDEFEDIRENSLILLKLLITEISTKNKHVNDCISLCMSAFTSRFEKKNKSSALCEGSEEVRKLLVETFIFLVEKFKEKMKDYLSESVAFLKSGYTDFYTIKILSFKGTISLCNNVPKSCFVSISPVLLKYVVKEMLHRRSKVREHSILCFEKLVLHDGAERNFLDIQGTIRQLACDHSYDVRLSLVKCLESLVSSWKENITFAKPLSLLLLILLSDEMEDISKSAFDTIEKLGKFYCKEKINDLKDDLEYKINEEIDFDSLGKLLKFPFSGKRPNLGSRLIVRSGMEKSLEYVITLSKDWNFGKKIVGANLLEKIAIYCEDSISSKLSKILINYFSIVDDEEEDVRLACYKAFISVGRYVSIESYVDLLCAHVNSQYSDSPKFLRNVFVVIDHLLQGICDVHLQTTSNSVISKVLESIEQPHLIFQPSEPLINSLLSTTKSLINVFSFEKDNEDKRMNVISFLMVIFHIASQPGGKKFEKIINESMEKLANKCSFITVLELIKDYFVIVMEKLTKEMKKWDKTSPQVNTFSFFLNKSKEVLFENDIFVFCVKKIIEFIGFDDCDKEVVQQLIGTLGDVLNVDQVEPKNVGKGVKLILREIIGPNFVWKVGKVSERIRMVTVKLLYNMISSNIIGRSDMKEFLKSSMKNVISCFDEDNVNLREYVVKICELLLGKWKDLFEIGTLKEAFVELEKGLNDNNDVIRIVAIRSLELLFDTKEEKESELEKEFQSCVKNLFIHIDDRNAKVQMQVFSTLSKLRGSSEKKKVFIKNLSNEILSKVSKFQNVKTKTLIDQLKTM